MLIVDANNLFFSRAINHFGKTKEPITDDSVRFVLTKALSTLSREFVKFGPNRVLTFDDRSYWRKDFFPHYKAKRRAEREAADFDWDAFFPRLNKFKDEVREFFPFQCLQVTGAEADDIIGVIAPRVASSGEPVCVWSSDTDDLQLQVLDPRIKQFSYVKKKFITPKSENYTLFEHIVRGDTGDGVPNILSASDHFVQDEKKRQKPIFEADLAKWIEHQHEPEQFCKDEEMLRRFKENRTLVDYRYIPDHIADAIIEAHENTPTPRGKIFGYMVTHRLTRIMKDGSF